MYIVYVPFRLNYKIGYNEFNYSFNSLIVQNPVRATYIKDDFDCSVVFLRVWFKVAKRANMANRKKGSSKNQSWFTKFFFFFPSSSTALHHQHQLLHYRYCAAIWNIRGDCFSRLVHVYKNVKYPNLSLTLATPLYTVSLFSVWQLRWLKLL